MLVSKNTVEKYIPYELCPLGYLSDNSLILSFSTKEVIRIFGSHNGGLIGRAEIGADVPLENAEAAYRAFYEHGVY